MIFKNKPYLSALAKGVTDLGGYADVVMRGGSIKHRLSNELTNGELSELVKHYKIKKYHGAFIDDRLPKKLLNGYYIINLNGRSHWTVLLKDGKNYFYFDSYGFVASQEVEDQIGEYVYSDLQLQHLNSSSCGYYVIAFMRFMQNHKHKDKKICYKSFLKLFSKDPKENEIILHQLLV
jgi:hypothetical protein